MKKSERALCLMSGGLDSTVTAAVAASECQIVGLHFSYGQRGEERERDCFQKLVRHFQCSQSFNFPIPIYAVDSGSSLIDQRIAVPAGTFDQNKIPSTYVPFRNGVMLASAAAIAESLGISRIFIGAVWEDSSGYPDCREEFLKALEVAVNLGTKPETKIAIEAPLVHKTKSEIARWGSRLNAPFELTWSCYHNGPEPCRQCESCMLRQKGFHEAGLVDPLLPK